LQSIQDITSTDKAFVIRDNSIDGHQPIAVWEQPTLDIAECGGVTVESRRDEFELQEVYAPSSEQALRTLQRLRFEALYIEFCEVDLADLFTLAVAVQGDELDGDSVALAGVDFARPHAVVSNWGQAISSGLVVAVECGRPVLTADRQVYRTGPWVRRHRFPQMSIHVRVGLE
jgi:hypothetical protein